MALPTKPMSLIERVEHVLLYPFRKGWPGIALGSIIVVLLLGMGVSAIANRAKPGDLLFFVDRGFEKFRVNTALSSTARFKQKVAIAEERLFELQQYDLSDTERLLSSLDELELALLDLKSEIINVEELSEAQESANQVAENLLSLVARYRAFLLGETEDTDGIQQELDESVDEINNIVVVAQKNNPTANISTVQASSSTATETNTSQSGSDRSEKDDEDDDDSCDTNYTNLGQEVEKEEVTLRKNSCGEYTVKFGNKTYVLITTDNLDYAVGQEVDYHGEKGTNNSIFLTEFSLDD